VKVKKHFYCIVCIVAVLALLTAGCGGGGSGSLVPAPPPSPPSNPPSPPSNPPDNPTPPSNPNNPLQPPPPSNPQTPSNPAPQLTLWYPGAGDPESVRVVGSGTLLTILGEVYGADQIEVYDQDGTLLETFSVTPGMFRIDLSRFGSSGRKLLRIVARGQGGESSVEVEVIYDEGVLEGLAQEAIARYRMKRFAKSPWCTEVPIPVWLNGSQKYRAQTEAALEFWSLYTQLKFQVVTEKPSPPAIVITDMTNKDPGIIAETVVGSSTGEILDVAGISLYAKFRELQPEVQISVLAHELWHALSGGAGHPDDLGWRFIGQPVGSIENKVIPPVIQRAFSILYSGS